MSVQTYITNKGVDLIAKSISGGFPIAFVGAEIGTGAIGGGDDPKTYNGLKVKYADALLSKTTYEGNATCKFSAQYTAGGLLTAVLITEIGIFATDPTLGKVLFAYTNLGDNPDRLFPADQASFYKFYDVAIQFTADHGVSVVINPNALIPATEAPLVATAGKLLRLDGNKKLPADITGNAEKLGGQTPNYYSAATHGHANATGEADGFMSKEDKVAHNTVVGRVNQDLKTASSPTFAGLTVNGNISGATFL